MKAVLLVVLATLSIAFAQTPSYAWAGTTAGGALFWVPDQSFGASSCFNSTQQSSFVALNISFPTTLVRNVIAAGDQTDFSGELEVFVYSPAFLPESPCTNFVRELSAANSYEQGPSIDDFVLFQANTDYVIVVSGESASFNGEFALNIFDSNFTGNNANGPVWSPVEYEATYNYTSESYTVNCTNENDDFETAPFALFSWVQPTTGLYDIIAGFEANITDDIDIEATLVLYFGAVTAAEVIGTPCINAIFGTNSDEAGATLFGITLTAGQAYTAVLSGEEFNQISNYGFWISPSRVAPTRLGFIQPEASGSTCVTQSSTSYYYPWVAVSAVAPFPTVVISTAEITYSDSPTWVSDDDTTVLVYSGVNVGSSVTLPDQCTNYLTVGNDIYSGLALDASVGSTYTFLLLGDYYYSSSTPSTNSVVFWALTGTHVGVGTGSTTAAAASTAAGATATGAGGSAATGAETVTGASTSSHAAAAASTSTGTSSSTTSLPITAGSTTSSACAVVSSVLFVAAAFFALL